MPVTAPDGISMQCAPVSPVAAVRDASTTWSPGIGDLCGAAAADEQFSFGLPYTSGCHPQNLFSLFPLIMV